MKKYANAYFKTGRTEEIQVLQYISMHHHIEHIKFNQKAIKIPKVNHIVERTTSWIKPRTLVRE